MKYPRRSIHFVPGGNARMFEKSLGLAADSLILDLEDAVTPDRKEAARQQVCDWLQETDFGIQERLVRINPLASDWGRDDVAAIMECAPDGIVFPKVQSLADVEQMDQLLQSLEKKLGLAKPVPLLLIGTEVAAAVFNLPTMSAHERVNGVTWGAEDLSASLGARAKRDADGNYLEVFSFVRSMCLLASVAAGVQPIDAVYVDMKDSEGLKKECATAADMGFTGKITIHPSQIDIVNAAFTPSDEEITHARDLVQAFAINQAEGRMAFSFRGEMVDVPHLRRAERVLKIVENLQ